MAKWDHHSVVEITSSTFPETPQVVFGFNSNGFKLSNIGGITVDYSFDGSIVHGKLDPLNASVRRIFQNRTVSKIWFKSDSSSGYVRIEGWGSSGVVSSGFGAVGSGGLANIPLFDINFNQNGVDELSPLLTLNSITESPIFRYKGGDATISTWPAWTYGETLDIAGSGADPSVNQGSPLLGANDDSVLFNTAKYFESSDNTFADLTSEDLVIEIIARLESGTNKFIGGKENPATADGFQIFFSSSALQCRIGTPAGAATQNGSAALTPGAWYYFLWVLDRSEASTSGGQIYVNGSASGAGVDHSSHSANTMTNTNFLTWGARTGGTLPLGEHIAYVSMWARDNWLSAQTGVADLAKERFAKMCGVFPQLSSGTAVPDVMTRASVAHIDKYIGSNRRIFSVGANWPRVCQRQDGAETLHKGVIVEPAAQNLMLQSNSLGTTWSPVRATITENDDYGADGDQNMDTLVEDGTGANTHSVAQLFSATDGVVYVVSGFARAITVNRDWILIQLFNSPGDTPEANFDIANGTVGTTNAFVDEAGIEDWGGGLYRWWARWTQDGTRNVSVQIYTGEADNDVVFDGLDQDSVRLGDIQVEVVTNEFGYPTSVHRTTTTATSRGIDTLRYKGDDGNLGAGGGSAEGALEIGCLLQNIDQAGQHYLIDISDGGSTADRIPVVTNASDVIQLLTRKTAENNGDVTGTTNISDGYNHIVRAEWETNRLALLVDDTGEGTIDTTCDPPVGLDRIDIGAAANGTLQGPGLITSLKILKDRT